MGSFTPQSIWLGSPRLSHGVLGNRGYLESFIRRVHFNICENSCESGKFAAKLLYNIWEQIHEFSDFSYNGQKNY